jgi:pyrroloquinoline-quinone synthase
MVDELPQGAVAFREALLQVMAKKTHWAWPQFTSGRVAKALLHVHLEQEYEVYVRDFPVLVGRAYVQCPEAAVRRELAENLYEEETGGLAAGRPHPELFLEYPRGLGFDLERFAHITLLPAAQRYRQALDEYTLRQGWAVACAVVTIFLEGTDQERQVLSATGAPPPPPLQAHPLVRYYGLPLESLALTRAHRGIEHEHRAAAWRVMERHVPAQAYPAVLEAMNQTLRAWLAYRDEVAHACGLT